MSGAGGGGTMSNFVDIICNLSNNDGWFSVDSFYFVNTVDSSAGDLGLIKCFVMLVVCHVVMCLAHGQSWSNEVKPFVARPVWYLVVMSLHYFDY